MQLHSLISSTSTRWRTFATIPRISGRSSLTTVWPLRFSPSARTVAFWSLGRSMTLRSWVTLSLATAAAPLRLRHGLHLVLGLLGPSPGLRLLHGLEHGARRDLVHVAAPETGHVVGTPQVLQT